MISFTLTVKPLYNPECLIISFTDIKWCVLFLVNQNTLLDSNKNETPFVICENEKNALK